jgi:hypothetical protein
VNPRHLPHLVRRFFGSFAARRPSPAQQQWVADRLDGAAARLFFAQDALDQAHAVVTARRVARAAPGRDDLVRAALLHDVGKTISGLGVMGRSIASLLAIAHLPAPSRMRQYLDHGRIGAEVLGGVGESALTVAFARSHHDPGAPAGIASADWETLRSADAE